MGSGGVAIAALPTVICLKVPFSDGLGGGRGYWEENIREKYRVLLGGENIGEY